MDFKARLVACGLAGGAAVAICSCGSSTPSEPGAAQLASSVQHSVRNASSVHVNGAVSANGVPVNLNLGINRAGDMSGTIRENGANLNVISASGKVYIKATPEFLKQANAPADVCTVVCGHWVELPPKEASQLLSQVSMASLTGGAGSSSGSRQAKVTEAGTATVNGQQAWVLKATDGTTVAVSQQSTPYPLRVESPNGGKQGVVQYSQWNTVPQPKAPPANQVINLSNLHTG